VIKAEQRLFMSTSDLGSGAPMAGGAADSSAQPAQQQEEEGAELLAEEVKLARAHRFTQTVRATAGTVQVYELSAIDFWHALNHCLRPRSGEAQATRKV
jgi:hypothetical protein